MRRFAAAPFAVTAFAVAGFTESPADESGCPTGLSALSRAVVSTLPAGRVAAESARNLARSRVGVTAGVQSAGSVAHRSGTMLARADGVVSAALVVAAVLAAVSWALPAFSHENAPSAVSAAAAVTEAARRFLKIMFD